MEFIQKKLKVFLEEKFAFYNNSSFILSDPIQIPHRFKRKEDIEISAFLTCIISWGNRKTIIKNAFNLMQLMDNEPYHFIMANEINYQKFTSFVHRTFNGYDCVYFIKSLQNIYKNHDGLEQVFKKGYYKNKSIISALQYSRQVFFELPHEKRTEKHYPDIFKNAACKRINMFLRWMVRKDNCGVDFGLWDSINMSDLYIPLDVHTGNTARKLGLIKNKSNNWKSVEELTEILKSFDPKDPAKYDFALYGIGINDEE